MEDLVITIKPCPSCGATPKVSAFRSQEVITCSRCGFKIIGKSLDGCVYVWNISCRLVEILLDYIAELERQLYPLEKLAPNPLLDHDCHGAKSEGSRNQFGNERENEPEDQPATSHPH
jgi:hypothetical protein